MVKFRSYIPLVFLLAFLTFLSSCTTTVKKTWRDFTAYYNTYYNAKRSFATGMEQVRDQRVNINPEQPVRVHTAPVGAGQQNFEKAIEKGAKILREYPDSRWVDEALLLIGKSNYYKEEYFSAEQKFRELYANADSPELEQKAILWRGLVFMEMELYSQGISYLQNELADYSNWKPYLKAEVQTVLAELYSYLQQWDTSNDYLVDAIPNLEDKTHKARAYFLHGQVLERLNRLEEAFGAYRQVPGLHPPYDIIYHARRKQAEVSRVSGNLKRAHRIFVEMSKDDKNFEILPELKYEIARTLQAMEEYEEAERIYNGVLHSSNQQTTAPTRAKTYYGLASLYRNYHKDYRTAAAYYDSAATVNVEKEKLPPDFQADQLSQSFGEYADLKKQIQKADSLMWLGSLPKAEFDSVLAKIRERRKEKLEQMQKNRRNQANTGVPARRGYAGETTQSGDQNMSGGFLNYQNKQLVMEGRQQFEAYWGNRPLVDHWRRLEMIRQLKESSDTSLTRQEGDQEVVESRKLQQLNIDLKEIPFSEEARQKKKQEVFKAQYELANTFFLSLNMPDSAKLYYNKIIKEAPDTASIIPQALYSLSELHYIENDTTKARQLGKRLVNEYPTTEYARRIANRFNFSLPERNQSQNTTNSDSSFVKYRSLNDSLTKLHSLARARAYKNFARQYEGQRVAAYALYKSAEQYLEAARMNASSEKRYRREQVEKIFADQITGNNLLASLNKQNNRIQPAKYPCAGVYWDSVQTVVDDLRRSYSSINVTSRIRASVDQDSLFSCRDIGLEAHMNENMKRYVNRLQAIVPDQRELDEAGMAFVQLRNKLNETLKVWKAEKRRTFALSHPSSKVAPPALHSAARQYMELGRLDSVYRHRADRWFKARQRYEENKRELQQKIDSLQKILPEDQKQIKNAQNSKKPPERKEENVEKAPERSDPPEQPQSRNRDDRQRAAPDRERSESSKRNNSEEAASSDTTREFSEEEIKQMQQQLSLLRDSAAAEPDYEEVFPYLGVYWDSTRTLLDQFAANFPNHHLMEGVNRLKEELAMPDVIVRQAEDSVRADTPGEQVADSLRQSPADSARRALADSLLAASDNVEDQSAENEKSAADSGRTTRPDTALIPSLKKARSADEMKKKRPDTLQSDKEGAAGEVYTCNELDVNPDIVGGMEDFTEKIEYPEKVQNMSMEGQATFKITFSKGGRVDQVDPVTRGTGLGINEAIEKAIKEHMMIKPVTREQAPVRVKCEITIPVILKPDQ